MNIIQNSCIKINKYPKPKWKGKSIVSKAIINAIEATLPYSQSRRNSWLIYGETTNIFQAKEIFIQLMGTEWIRVRTIKDLEICKRGAFTSGV